MTRQPTTIALALLYCVCAASQVFGQEAEREIARELRQRIDVVGKPHEPISIPDDYDHIYQSEGRGTVVGRLTSLTAFATIELPQVELGGEEGEGGESGEKTERRYVGRGEVTFILFDGKGFPASPPLLPANEDAVLTDAEEVITGSVTVSGETVTVGGRSIPARSVTLIHLKSDRPPPPSAAADDGEVEDAEQADDPSEDSDPGEVQAPPGKSCWHGHIFFTLTRTHPAAGTTEEERVRLEVAIKEDKRLKGEQMTRVYLRSEWTVYDLWYKHKDEKKPRQFHRPNPYEVMGLADGSQATVIGDVFYYSPEWIENYGERYGHRNGQYNILTPLFDGPKLGWGDREWRFDDGKWSPTGPPVFSLFAMDQGSRDHLHLVEDLDLMRGRSRKLVDLGGSAGTVEGVMQWNIRRNTGCPPPPRSRPSEDADDCSYEQAQLEEWKRYLEEVGPLAEKLEADLRSDAERLEKIADELAFYEPFFQQAMTLAGVGGVSMEVLKALLPARLAQGAPAGSLAKQLPMIVELLGLAQDPEGWTRSKFLPGTKEAMEIYQRARIAKELLNHHYQPALEYIARNMEVLSSRDNPISIKARKYVEAVGKAADLMRKVSLELDELVGLQGDMKNAQLNVEFWEEELRKCQEQAR